jgi:hypothetical protein
MFQTETRTFASCSFNAATNWPRLPKHRQQSRVAAEIVVKVLVGLQACERNGRDALLKRLQPLHQRLLAFNACEFIFERRQDGLGLGAATNSGKLRRQFDDTAISNLQHGGHGLHVH